MDVSSANEEKGPRNKRELTETTPVMFVDTSSRDQALNVIETKYPKGPDQNLGAKIEIMGTQLFAARARTKIQKARNWALRKAYELIQVRVVSEVPGAVVEFDWTMPVRKVLVNGESAFVQPKETLHGTFVGPRFESLRLPA